jgi:hypothetical protein
MTPEQQEERKALAAEAADLRYRRAFLEERRFELRMAVDPVLKRVRIAQFWTWEQIWGEPPADRQPDDPDPPHDHRFVTVAAFAQWAAAQRHAVRDELLQSGQVKGEIKAAEDRLAAITARIDTLDKVPLSRARTAKPVRKINLKKEEQGTLL